MIYEFECVHGHVTEASVPMDTKEWTCTVCCALYNAGRKRCSPSVLAKRILSPTRTTFVFADTHRSST